MKTLKKLICLLFLISSLNVSVNVSGCLSEGVTPRVLTLHTRGTVSEGTTPRGPVKFYYGLYDRKSKNILGFSSKKLKRRAMKLDKFSIYLNTDKSKIEETISLLRKKESCILDLEIYKGNFVKIYFFDRKYIHVEYFENGELCGEKAYSDGETIVDSNCRQLDFLNFIFREKASVNPGFLVSLYSGIFINRVF